MRKMLMTAVLGFLASGTAMAQVDVPAQHAPPAAADQPTVNPAMTPASPEAPTSAAPAPTPPVEAAPRSPLVISGKVYADLSYLQSSDNGANKTTQSVGVDVKRFYLGVDYTLDKIMSAQFVSDVGDHQGKYDIFVKKAFIQAKLSKAFILRAGSADTPWIPFVEDRYGYRYLEQTLIDRTKYDNSADWGLHLLGNVANGVIGYQVSVINGNGYGNPTRSRWPAFEARVDAKLADHLTIALGAELSKLGATTTTPNLGQRYDALVAWDDARFRVGVEGFLGKDDTADEVTGKAPADTAYGVSAFASYRIVPKAGVFARFDYVEPNADTDTGNTDTYVNAGFDIAPYKFLDIALAYKHETVDTGMKAFVFNTGNGKIGSATPNSSGSYDEIGVFSQLKF